MIRKRSKIGFIFASGLFFLLMLAVLELNQNSLLGLLLFLICSAGFWIVHRKFLRTRRFSAKGIAWLAWIGVFILILFVTWPPVRAVPAVEGDHPEKTRVIRISQGDLQGVVTSDGLVEVYAGIPYAKPPVGELRWKEPQAPESWDGILQADHFAPMSMQPQKLPIVNSLTQIIGYHDYEISLRNRSVPPVSEDSLYLNVWRPVKGDDNLPVLVYIHGGSLQTGQPWYRDYSGEGLAREGIIVVNMGYRLGVFGYFASEELRNESENGTTGNYGLLDQISALQWVQNNIAAFGGDPDNVTLAGESAGSASVSALCASPLASGLFERVILESSTVASEKPPHSFRLLDEALESGAELKTRHGCETVAQLRAVPAQELVSEADTQHHITVDGYALLKSPVQVYRSGDFNEKAILHGYNSRESGPFILFSQANLKNFEEKVRGYFGEYSDEVLSLYPVGSDQDAKDAWAEIWGAVFFDYPHYCYNRLAVSQNIPVYEYYFSKDNGRLGPWHSGEQVYFYGNIPAQSKLYNETDRNLSKTMSGYFLNFIKTGNPNGGNLPIWEQNTDSASLMAFGETCGMITEEKHALYGILDRMNGWM